MSADEQLFELSTLFRTFLKGVSQEWQKRGYQFNQTQFKVLFSLHKHGPQNGSQLASSMCLTSAAITGVTDHLLTEGFVEKNRDESDRRIVTIRLTPKGDEMVKEFLENQMELIKSHFGVLPPEDIEHLRRIFRVLIAEIEAQKE
ncbi:MarR family transcriptional regulator [Gorillibacterium sp. CAU 1737]|uniref:MarR family winged helix-turn-helix transcriptional regulator n=1 Tax=Gorillibacterium sp. CAU 1737 TaxID=3140362 RepID=UPI0032606937